MKLDGMYKFAAAGMHEGCKKSLNLMVVLLFRISSAVPLQVKRLPFKTGDRKPRIPIRATRKLTMGHAILQYWVQPIRV